MGPRLDGMIQMIQISKNHDGKQTIGGAVIVSTHTGSRGACLPDVIPPPVDVFGAIGLCASSFMGPIVSCVMAQLSIIALICASVMQ